MSETPSDKPPRVHNPNFCGKKGRSGPPKGSQNGAKHYMRAGKLPRKLAYIEHRINALRRHLEEAVLAAKGREADIADAAAINSATKWERHGLLAQHWMRHEGENMSAGERLKFSQEICKASDNRDKNIRLLGLDIQKDPWIVLDGTSIKQIESDEQ